ncbi:hypothetical protein POPTR_018G104400v4 [Populus trichocarpa]|uniref:Uncharacterized protein n=2 Tax=Populus trichocarpa TaxID=3694 RepID=A0A3N7I5D2_POPTR|nr:hypothetical protein POPTR_018G104400v4 [Populus trichocarpa]
MDSSKCQYFLSKIPVDTDCLRYQCFIWILQSICQRNMFNSRRAVVGIFQQTSMCSEGHFTGSYFSLADMTQMRSVFTFLLFSLLLLSHSLPSSAVKSQFDKVPTKSQLPQGRQNGLINSFQTPKLGVHIKKRARFYPRSGRKSSAVRTQLPSSHIIGSVLAFLSFFLF